MRHFTVTKWALKYSWKITYEFYPLLMSENRTSLHCHRYPRRLRLPAHPSKVIGRVSTTWCLYIQFSGDGFLPPLSRSTSLPSACSRLPSGHNASGGHLLEVSHCDLPREQKQEKECYERREAFSRTMECHDPLGRVLDVL